MPKSVKELVENVRELAEEYPDAMYVPVSGDCWYDDGDVENGPEGQGCIFGHASIQSTRLASSDRTIDAVLKNLFGLDDDAWMIPVLRWCRTVQSYQDDGVTWSEAVELADTECGRPEDYLQ